MMRLISISIIFSMTAVGAVAAQNYATSVPVYEAYEPTVYDAGAYEAATQPFVPAPILDVQPNVGEIIYQSMPNDPGLGDNLSLSLGAPETFAAPESEPRGELGFSEETKTSRLLLALEKTYAARVSEMKAKHLAQRRAMLDAFERDATDPNKVIGLAERMRAGLAGLEAVQNEAMAEEERQYTAAMLSVLDTAPSRAE